VPDVRNHTVVANVPAGFPSAQTQLAVSGLVAGTITRVNSPVVAGLVIAQSPLAGGTIAPGGAVNLTVSLGPAPANTVPAVIGLARADAASAITAVGLAVGVVSFANSAAVAAGSVILTNPVAGTSRPAGSTVAMTVSLGPDGLVAAFGFDEAGGTNAADSSVVGLPGTIRQATHVPGVFGSALSFDGVNDWVTLNDTANSAIDLTNGMTIEAWVRPTSMSGWETVVMKERGATGSGLLSYALYAHDGAPASPVGFTGPAAYLRMNPVLSTTDQAVRDAAHTPLTLNVWTHLATTYDGASMRFYVNGVLVATQPLTGTIAAGNQPLRIGGNNVSGEFFNGLIDEVRIYNRARTPAQIAADLNTPIVR
jgi:hypothetical protein